MGCCYFSMFNRRLSCYKHKYLYRRSFFLYAGKMLVETACHVLQKYYFNKALCIHWKYFSWFSCEFTFARWKTHRTHSFRQHDIFLKHKVITIFSMGKEKNMLSWINSFFLYIVHIHITSCVTEHAFHEIPFCLYAHAESLGSH